MSNIITMVILQLHYEREFCPCGVCIVQGRFGLGAFWLSVCNAMYRPMYSVHRATAYTALALRRAVNVILRCKFLTLLLPDRQSVGTRRSTRPKQKASLGAVLHQQTLGNVTRRFRMKPSAI